MHNLEQLRARNVWAFAYKQRKEGVSGENGGEVIKKIAPHIIKNGLLATAAYSFSENEGWKNVFDAIAIHLSDKDNPIVPLNVANRHTLMDYLTRHATSDEVKLATTETISWLEYARRFVQRGGSQ